MKRTCSCAAGAGAVTPEPSSECPRTGPALRVALYSHDTMGIGHMRRNLLIARTLAGPPLSATVLLIAGAREAGAFPTLPGVDCLTLPALQKSPDGHYHPRGLGVPLRELIEIRAKSVAAALRAFRPDVLVVDKEPRGVAGELDDALRGRGGTRCVLGLRDVLDDPATVRREWASAGNEEVVKKHYDAVWVYGDPGVYDLVREYRLGPAFRSKVTYTGYLDPHARLESGPGGEDFDAEVPDRPFALCTVGGGQDGARVAEAFAEAALPAGLGGVVVTGPFMPAESRERLHRRARTNPNLRVLEFVREPCRLMRRAQRVVAMGGYNTTCELLAFGKPALVVPRVAPRREQAIRAERLRALGLFDVLHPDRVCPQTLSRWLASAAAADPVRGRVDMGGTRRLSDLVRGLLPAAPDRPPVTQALKEATRAGL